MPALKNQRHEKFVLALFEGKTATEAYTAAGYKSCRKNAARLTTKDDIKTRLTELQNAVAKKSEVTVQSLLDELEHARSRADSLDQLSAAVKATSEKAKISGLLVQKIEVGGPDDFNPDETNEQMADKIARSPTPSGRIFTADEQEEFRAWILDWLNWMSEFLGTHGRYPWVVGGSASDQVDRERRERQRQRRLGRQQQQQQQLGLTNGNGRYGRS